MLLMVSVFGGVSMQQAISDSTYIRKWNWINTAFIFSIATLMYVKSFFDHFSALKGKQGNNAILEQIEAVFIAVSGETESIKDRIDTTLHTSVPTTTLVTQANVTGIVFLTLLVIVNGL